MLLNSARLINLPESELKKAQDIHPGQNIPDTLLTTADPAVSTLEPVETPAPPLVVKPSPRPIEPVKKLRKAEPVAQNAYFKNFTPFTFRVMNEDLTALLNAEHQISRNGREKPIRITKNAIVRALLALFRELDLDFSQIESETQLRNLIYKHCGIRPKS